MPPFTFAASKTALITGGASGIGLAKKCLGHGMKVLIVDNNDGFLASARGRIDFLFLNAGIQPSSAWDDPSAFQNIFNVNFYGVMNGITTFKSVVSSLSSFSSAAAIVITGSKQGITNPPGNPAYSASKFAVRTIAEHLSYDLRDSSPSTSVFLLVPGWTVTSLRRSEEERTSAEKPAAPWTPEQVADYLEAKVVIDEFYVICPDNEVTEEMDAKRMLWAAEDVVQRRPALSRWREEYKGGFEAWVRS
ncbi:short-chain dehydrogenase/reductase [Colletotrichum fioriniae PJ7]|uniref:Short-chain dehydrogenase/reductase n=1 Tax=Colletotrichum fioriniae PJ7 TaxID=1445577 RepID=A0A010R304_9PEZI|nr:short-chain dehydrogenase/reductase [Colletotrichum fioriniae PJ7]